MNTHTTFQDNAYNKLITQYVFLIICVLPLFYIPFGFPDPFYLPKMLLWFISIVAILILVLLAKIKLHDPVFLSPNQTKDQKWVLLILFLYFISWCLSSIFSFDKVASFAGINTFNGLLQIVLGIATFLLVSNHYDFKPKHMIFVVVTYTIISILSVLQFYGLDPFRPIYGEQVKRFYDQTFSTIGNQNQVATCLCVVFIITAFFFITSDQGPKRNRLLLVGILIIFAGNVVTNSKAGIIADGATMLVALPLIMKNRIFLKRYIQILICSIGIFIVINLSSNSVVINRLLQMLFEGFEMLQGNVDTEYGSGRIEIWTNSIELIKHYWLVGSGPDTFKQIYDMFGFNIVNSNNEKSMVLSPHNESLRLLITTGIASLVFYWVLLISIMKKGFQKIYEDTMMMPFILGLVCYEIKLMFNCSSVTDIIIFWVLLAIVFRRATSYGKMNANPR